jgi:hypothetical protein
LPEELFGATWARRFRVGIPAATVVLLIGGGVAFALWSQTIGRIVLVLGFGLGLMWFLLRRGDPEGAWGALHRARTPLIVLGGVLFVSGLVVFATVDQDLGLLLVLLGGMALVVNLLTVKQEPFAGPLDGPPYGDTPPYGE